MPFLYVIVALTVATTIAASTLSAQDLKGPGMAPSELVQATVKNEVAAANNTAIKFMFHSRKQTTKGVQTKVYVEANEALASMVIRENDRQLNPKEEQEENDRLAEMTHNPDELRKEQARQKREVEHTLRIVKALPHAFCYEYAGTERGNTGLGKSGDQLVRLNFRPNPSYSPPSRVEQVLQGMEGYLLIDTKALRIARLEGTLFREVSFGWGIFGHLDKGGHFRVQQGDAGDGNWAITETSLNVTGKIMLVKSLKLISDEIFSDFRRLPDDLPFAQAVDLLRTEQEKLAKNSRAYQVSESSATSQ